MAVLVSAVSCVSSPLVNAKQALGCLFKTRRTSYSNKNRASGIVIAEYLWLNSSVMRSGDIFSRG